ncbi:hypothetical protein J437_LFUL004154 [Ladona fulva]|uniref:Uncharacterized protein n=1 Tax=Ladona fulva TaxID=123851 RepID=A0A8K0K4V7_LADFU|nr:hypothetical protein J437_LFUL004154 [Ladona fulva]
MKEQCQVIEKLKKEGKLEEMYNTVKRLTMRKTRAIAKNGMTDEQGRIRTEDEDIKGIWEEYIKDLYCTNDRGREVEIELRNYEEGERDNGGPNY